MDIQDTRTDVELASDALVALADRSWQVDGTHMLRDEVSAALTELTTRLAERTPRRVLESLGFDLSGIPEGAAITRASLMDNALAESRAEVAALREAASEAVAGIEAAVSKFEADYDHAFHTVTQGAMDWDTTSMTLPLRLFSALRAALTKEADSDES